ncbi:16S rRNA (cytidine(1402)-2'-O)-methyltransferase [Rhodothermus profundi]|uniref:Ribosomal RNA small subunit methyltransferase I n=1 Tax=Rhodothermus profundi TaxID=633813 RepID=A0A1M6TRB8_9BACT|nr:16S rRNA (cytidine(1402)-2'-O)-methyltransferase [Rhodothermus profundi]SHK59460.1 16S rRNA (cytidine1402-2'-O)-methyltransferase [Rhodothermus profundi]
MLYLVPTPIGNLEDLTLRALRILREVDLIACEDTRTSAKLLRHYGITTPTTSYHAHNEARKAAQLVARMEAGARVALITDAGTPGISDPGFRLVRACLQRRIPVIALPGPTAFVPALAASGLPTDRFVFEGFLPTKKGRQKRLAELATEPRTMVLYEAPHRLVRTLGDLAQALGDERPAVVARELTKTFEAFARGTLRTLHAYYAAQPRVRGEIVLIVAGTTYRPDPDWPREQALIMSSYVSETRS